MRCDGQLRIELLDAGVGTADGSGKLLRVSGRLDLSGSTLQFWTLSGSSLNDAAYVIATHGSVVGVPLSTYLDCPRDSSW